MVAIRSATSADRTTLAASLASAFSEDPLFGWIARVDGGPVLEGRMAGFFDAFLKINLAKPDHLVFVSDDGTGAAIWQPVGKWKVPPADLLRAMPAMVRAFRMRVPAMMSALTAIEKVHPAEPHYYLEVLGTRKDKQSKGVGSAVITAGLERCDEEGVGAYLESSNARNVPFYARHGFETREELNMGKASDGPLVTTMWREPRGLIAPRRSTAQRLGALTLVAALLAAGCGDDLKTSETCEHGDQNRSSATSPSTTEAPEQTAAGQLSFEPVYCLDLADPYVLVVDRLIGERLFVFGTTIPLAHIPVLIPRGLIRTEKILDALPDPPTWAKDAGGWAPSALARGDGFVLYYTITDAASDKQCISVAVSERAEGPYTDTSTQPLVCPVDLGGAIDPSPFVDADGTAHLLWKSDGNCCDIPTRIWSQPLAEDGRSLTGAPTALLAADQPWEGGVVEGPSMLRTDDGYFLFYSANAWNTAAYGIGYATCAGIAGPCTKPLDHAWIGSSPDAAGPGGPEVYLSEDGIRMVFHAWIDGNVGYADGGHRSLFTTGIAIENGAPVQK